MAAMTLVPSRLFAGDFVDVQANPGAGDTGKVWVWDNAQGKAVLAALNYEPAGAVAAHAALTSGVHGISVFGGSLIDDANASAARTTLGLGTAATANTGTSAGNVVVLDGTAKLPAVDGSQLTNLPGGGGTPGGSTTQVQYNSDGAFAGDAGLTYDAANDALTVAGRVVTPVIRPASDSTTAVRVQNAAGTNSIIVVDTIGRRVGVNRQPQSAQFEFAQSSGSVEQLLAFYDNSNNARITLYSNGAFESKAIPATVGSPSNTPASNALISTRWTGSVSANETFELLNQRYDSGAGRHAFYIKNSTTGVVQVAVSGGSYGQVAIGNAFPSDAQTGKGKLWVTSPDTSWKGIVIQLAASPTANAFEIQSSASAVLSAITKDGYFAAGQSSATALIDLAASTSSRASLRIRSGVAPTTPNDGDIWQDGTNIKIHLNGVTKTFTLT